MLFDPLSFLENVTSTYKPVVGLIMGGEEVILVADPAAAQQVLIDKASIYNKVRCFDAMSGVKLSIETDPECSSSTPCAMSIQACCSTCITDDANATLVQSLHMLADHVTAGRHSLLPRQQSCRQRLAGQ